MEHGTGTLENILAIFYKTKYSLAYNTEITLLGIYPRKMNTMFTQNLYMDVYTSFIPNCQTLEITQVSFNGV